MTILTFPVLAYNAFDKYNLMLNANSLSFRSPLSNAVQTVEMPGALWAADFTLRPGVLADERAILAFLASLRGEAGRFWFWDISGKSAAFNQTAFPLVNGTNPVRNLLYTYGWSVTPGATILKAGDLLGVQTTSSQSELKMVTQNVVCTDGTNASFTIEPPLRADTINASSVVLVKPVCLMKLTDNTQCVNIAGDIASFSLKFEEVLS